MLVEEVGDRLLVSVVRIADEAPIFVHIDVSHRQGLLLSMQLQVQLASFIHYDMILSTTYIRISSPRIVMNPITSCVARCL